MGPSTIVVTFQYSNFPLRWLWEKEQLEMRRRSTHAFLPFFDSIPLASGTNLPPIPGASCWWTWAKSGHGSEPNRDLIVEKKLGRFCLFETFPNANPENNLLGPWLNFKLFGITYLVGKVKFKLLFQGPLAKWDLKNTQQHGCFEYAKIPLTSTASVSIPTWTIPNGKGFGIPKALVGHEPSGMGVSSSRGSTRLRTIM